MPGCRVSVPPPPRGGVEKVRLKRQLGLLHAVAFICGLVIGTGIWVSPQAIMESTNSVGASLLIWLLWGLLSAGIALVYAELGATFPRSGGKYIYMEEAFGSFLAFIYIWAYLIMTRPASNAIKVLTFAVYVLKPAFPDCPVPKLAVLLLAYALLFLLMFINIVDIKAAARGQGVFSGICIVALVAIAITGFVWLGEGYTDHFKAPFKGTSDRPEDIILGFYACYFCYAGMDVVNFVVEELKDPLKTLPRAIFISITIITTLYLLVNVAFIAVLGRDGIIASDAVAASFAHATLGRFAWVMALLIAVNTAGSFNSGTLVGSRLCFVAAREGHLPRFLHLVNVRYLSPITALIFLCTLTALFCLFDVRDLLTNLTIAGILSDALCMAALLWLRYKRPDINRPFKLPIVIPAFLCILLGTFVFVPLVIDPVSSGLGILLVLGTGVPYYLICIVWRPRIAAFDRGYDAFVRILQKSLNCTKETEPLTPCASITHTGLRSRNR